MPDFSTLIISWYGIHKRNLPWRNTNDPYPIWLSEVILQQTRVDQGTPYFNHFIALFPSIHDLASASEQTVLKAWEGLGYYSRARNLHHTAKTISNELKGVFPSTYAELLRLKGIGPYTAAAIASFSFNACIAVVDGNVYRVLSRVFDLDIPINSPQGQRMFAELAQQIISEQKPAEHNQAIMELGALICLPTQPKCPNCPLVEKCLSFANKTILNRPVKHAKKKPRSRYFIHFVFLDEDQTLIQQRLKKDIWQHLYEFPGIEVGEQEEHRKYLEGFGEPIESVTLPPHILSHQRIHATFYVFNNLPERIEAQWILSPLANLHTYPFSRLTLKFLETKSHF
jgi:A/G-specific adenine glycosylase